MFCIDVEWVPYVQVHFQYILAIVPRLEVIRGKIESFAIPSKLPCIASNFILGEYGKVLVSTMIEYFWPAAHTNHLGTVLRVVLPVPEPFLKLVTIDDRLIYKFQYFIHIHIHDIRAFIDVV